MPELLAKSKKGGKPVTLGQHSQDVETAALKLFSHDSRLLKNWMRFFGLQDEFSFLHNLQIACLFHDLGKANEAFIADVIKGRFSQPIRHEHLSALIICLRPVREWLLRSEIIDFDTIIAAVLSHHLKASNSRGEWPWGQVTGNPSLQVYLNHSDIHDLFSRIGNLAGLHGVPDLPMENWPLQVWEEAWEWGTSRAEDLEKMWLFKGLDKKDDLRNSQLAVKAALIAADALGSAIRREQHDLDDFLARTLHRTLLTGKRIWEEIINPRVQEIQRQGKAFTWDHFQESADALPDRAAIVAACGAGKTLAAWRWAAAMAAKTKIGTVIFLYPTRATATEGFKDYVAWAPEAKLLTGTAPIDLAGIMQNPPESLKGKDHDNFYEDEREARFFTLANWHYPYFSATLDQFLSFLEHSYSGLCLLPQLADAAVIVDEAHSLDRQLFERLQALVTHFQGPLLLMSASLPRERAEALRKSGVKVFPEEAERTLYQSLVDEEERKRYKMIRYKNLSETLGQVGRKDQVEKRSTLWVVNTVKRCQKLALQLLQDGRRPLVYHSRFKARDRRVRHAEVISAFKGRQTVPSWAVTTQVCEMSLDLDADRLVTEDSPLPSLIQRMGRANRSKSRDRSFRAEVIIYKPEDGRPYNTEIGGADMLQKVARFANDFNGLELCQRELSLALKDNRYAEDAPLPRAWASFLCEGWYASTHPLRGEEGDRDVRCVLDSDLALGLDASGLEGDPLEAWVLNVPRRLILKDYKRPDWLVARYIYIADGRLYSPALGFLLIDKE